VVDLAAGVAGALDVPGFPADATGVTLAPPPRPPDTSFLALDAVEAGLENATGDRSFETVNVAALADISSTKALLSLASLVSLGVDFFELDEVPLAADGAGGGVDGTATCAAVSPTAALEESVEPGRRLDDGAGGGGVATVGAISLADFFAASFPGVDDFAVC